MNLLEGHAFNRRFYCRLTLSEKHLFDLLTHEYNGTFRGRVRVCRTQDVVRKEVKLFIHYATASRGPMVPVHAFQLAMASELRRNPFVSQANKSPHFGRR